MDQNDSQPKKIGAPTKFNQNLTVKILELAEKGKTDLEIAEAIGVCEKTINNWKHKHPDFLQSLRESKSVADDLVEVALFRRAVGYKTKSFQDIEMHGNVIRLHGEKEFPPDTQAAQFWLQNRKPDQWKQKQAVEHTGADGKPLQSGPQTVIILPDNGRSKKD